MRKSLELLERVLLEPMEREQRRKLRNLNERTCSTYTPPGHV